MVRLEHVITINSALELSKINFLYKYDYNIGQQIKINPFPKYRIALIFYTWNNNNSFIYTPMVISVPAYEEYITLDAVYTHDGSRVGSGIVDMQIILMSV